MIQRFILAAVLAGVMVVVGVSTYVYMGSRQSKVAAPVEKPTTVVIPRHHALVLPGTLYLAQSGALYSLSSGRFHQLTSESGWTQPSLYPDGSNLLVVKMNGYWSDVYVMNPFGTPVRQLTDNRYRFGLADPSLSHWSFYPRLSPDGGTLWMTYDGLKCDGCYDVSPAVYAMPLGGSIQQARAWTSGGYYSGGDHQPVPVPGGVIYTKYDYADNYDINQPTRIVGMLWFTNRAGAYGKELTSPAEDCRTPSLSPDGHQLAMVCTYQKQVSYLSIASWNGTTLGPRTNVVIDQLVAQPTWAPDGSGIAFLAPGVADGPFQLWWLPKDAYAPPPPPPAPPPTPGGPHNGPLPSPSVPPPPPPVKAIEVTFNAGFDATSPMAWLG